MANRARHLRPEVDGDSQLALFDLPGGDAIGRIDPEGRNGAHGGDAGQTTGTGDALSRAAADHAVLGVLEQTLEGAREAGDDRPALVVLATCLGALNTPPALAPSARVSLRQARDEWLRRLDAQQKSESTLVGYRVAIDDLLDWSDSHGRGVLEESEIVDYLRSYRERASPAESTYYRRFVLLRSFLRWVSSRHGLPDPFRDLEAPPKPRQESDWLTPDEFRRLLDAAGHPERNLPGLAERDQLVLLTLVLTGLRRSELCALDWRDLELDGRKPSLLVRSGKGGKSRRQPIPASLARQLQRLAKAHSPGPADPVLCGLQGGRLQQTILADIIGRAAKRAGLEKHVTVHTLRHTAATWLRQELGDTRLVAEYLGHADLSTVARYAHVDREELFEAAGRLEKLATATEPRAPPDPADTSDPSDPSSPTADQSARPESPRVVAGVAASMVATAEAWASLSTQDVASKLEQPLGAAQCDGQLASGDWDQPVLRGVLQVEQVEQRLCGSIAVDDLPEQRCCLSVVVAARTTAERCTTGGIRGGYSREDREGRGDAS